MASFNAPAGTVTPGVGSLNFGVTGPPKTFERPIDPAALSSALAYSLTADPGTFALTGTDAALKAARTVSAVSGSFAFTGSAATTDKGDRVQAASGTFTITGSAASFRRTYVLGATTGSVAISGTAVTFKRGLVFPAGTGTYAITGTAATLRRGLRVPALAASFVITGTAATFRRGLVATAAPGSFLITGTTASFRRTYALASASGAYVITGTAATLIHGTAGAFTLVATAASYTETGSSVSLSRTAHLTAAPGACAITGSAAGLRRSFTLPASSASFAITGFGVNVRAGHALAAITVPIEGATYKITGTPTALLPSTINRLGNQGETSTRIRQLPHTTRASRVPASFATAVGTRSEPFAIRGPHEAGPNSALTFFVDGAEFDVFLPVTTGAPPLTAQQACDSINSQITGVTALAVDGHVVIRADRVGTTISIDENVLGISGIYRGSSHPLPRTTKKAPAPEGVLV